MENFRGENIDEFVENNLALYVSIVNKFNRDNCYTCTNDLLEYCMVKYLESCQKYDESKGIKFSTFLTKIIRNTISTYYTFGREYKFKKNEYLSLNNRVNLQSENSDEYIDTIDYRVDKFETASNQILINEIFEYVDNNFNDRDTQIFYKYLENYNLKTIAEEFNTTHQNISMIVQRIKKKIRSNFDCKFD